MAMQSSMLSWAQVVAKGPEVEVQQASQAFLIPNTAKVVDCKSPRAPQAGTRPDNRPAALDYIMIEQKLETMEKGLRDVEKSLSARLGVIDAMEKDLAWTEGRLEQLRLDGSNDTSNGEKCKEELVKSLSADDWDVDPVQVPVIEVEWECKRCGCWMEGPCTLPGSLVDDDMRPCGEDICSECGAGAFWPHPNQYEWCYDGNMLF